MSGSSHVDVTFSRCVVSLDAGVSIDWAPDADGSFEHGRLHHEREEAEFRARLERARPAIEVLFDELEQAGRQFIAPDGVGWQAQCVSARAGLAELVDVRVVCSPSLDDDALRALAERIAKLLEAQESSGPLEPALEPLAARSPPVATPWWKFW